MGLAKTIFVQASLPGRTYIGGEFCATETGVRDVFQELAPDVCLDIQQIRGEAQMNGFSDPAAINELPLTRPQKVLFRNCIAKIAAGNCTVRPRP